MTMPLRRAWTLEQFFAWDGHNEARYEFDGERPVAMNGGTITHALIIRNLHRALDRRLAGSGCRALGPDAGLATIGRAVRYPDALVTCARLDGRAHVVPGVVAVFEVLSPGSGRIDRIIKLREYAAVPSIRRYAILEYASAAATLLAREAGGQPWTATSLMGGDDSLDLPDIGISIPVAEVYEGIAFGDEAASAD